MSMKNYKESLKYFESAISINNKNGKYFYNKGKCLYELKRKNDAMYSFDKAIQIGTQNLIESYYYKGLSLYDLQILKESKNSLISCLNLIYKEITNSKNDITQISKINDEFSDKTFEKNLYIHNKYLNNVSKIFYYLGLIDYNEKNYKECLNHLNMCLQYNRKSDLAYYNKGLCYTALNKQKDAKECYEKAISINPRNDQAHFKIGFIFYNMGEKVEAIKHFAESFTINNKNYYAAHNMGKCYQDLKKYENALEWYNQSLRVEKHYYSSLYNKGRVLIELKRYDEAIETFKKKTPYLSERRGKSFR